MKHHLLTRRIAVVALVLASGLMIASPLRATVINHTSLNGDPGTVPVVDEDGNDIAAGTGTVAIGFFSTFSDAAISAQHGNLTLAEINAIMSDFVIFGTTGAIGDVDIIEGGIGSVFDYNTEDSLTDTHPGTPGWQNPFAVSGVGRNYYTVIGNVNSGGNGNLADLLNSSQLLVYRHDETWQENPPFGAPNTVNLSVDFSSSNGTLLLGGSFAETGYTTNLSGLLTSQTSAVALEGIGGEVIPEPSRLIFAVMGIALCGMRRRR